MLHPTFSKDTSLVIKPKNHSKYYIFYRFLII